MNYLHYTFKAAPDNTVSVTLNEKANVILLDTLNYYKYQHGKEYQPNLEFKETPSFNFEVPYKSQWHVIIEHGRFQGLLKAVVDVMN